MRVMIGFLLFIVLSTYANASVEAAYHLAMINSTLHKPEMAATPLTTIQGKKVKMLVFTTYNGYTLADKKLDANIWATVSPELKTRCIEYVKKNKPSHTQLNLWISQLLGLPPKDMDKRRFVEFEVPDIQAYVDNSAHQIGIFRPCRDPRIAVHTDNTPICPPTMHSSNRQFNMWFSHTSAEAHKKKNGVLWTEYGYTYNWNERANSIVGLSEFVVLKDTPMTVFANPNDASTPYIPAENYCR